MKKSKIVAEVKEVDKRAWETDDSLSDHAVVKTFNNKENVPNNALSYKRTSHTKNPLKHHSRRYTTNDSSRF